MIKKELALYIEELQSVSVYNFDIYEIFELIKFEDFIDLFNYDFKRYYPHDVRVTDIKYFRGLISTLFYRISRLLYTNNQEKLALEISSFSFMYTGIEIYYSSEIGKGLKINHGVGTVIGARTVIGENVLLHHNITIGEKKGRPILGNNIIIYPGAVIVGDIKIGDNNIVGANKFIDKSIEYNKITK